MNKLLKRRWLKALRSGEYKQGKGYLRINVADMGKKGEYLFCCLGVLDVVAGRKTWRGDMADITIKTKDKSLTRDVRRELSIKNDTGKSFKNIANWIANNL